MYCSQSIYRVIRTRRITWAGRVASVGEMRNTGRVLVGKPEGNRLLGRPRLDEIIRVYCGKCLQFCHGYSNTRYFSLADSVRKLCVRQRQLAQVSFKHLQCARLNSIRTLRAVWLCPSSVKGFGSQQWTLKSLKRRVRFLQQLLNSGFLAVISISN